ncbi:hypothetical protein D3C87_1388850 [compost metagenome]
MIASLLGFRLDIEHLKAVWHIFAEHLTATLNREAPHVGDDVATRLDSRDHIGMNSPTGFIGARGTVMDFNRHASPPEHIQQEAGHKRLGNNRQALIKMQIEQNISHRSGQVIKRLGD